MELDSYLQSNIRFLKVTDTEDMVSYKRFDGLPVISFTEKDIGNTIEVVRSILIPN
jgi:hypothetical protein